ncbi:MAG: winged helix-turn-helix transcriptional regulator [Clostridia bacterium]|nr:winged helix-turn-helix transcriptional regulator [Clostridia bacterium]
MEHREAMDAMHRLQLLMRIRGRGVMAQLGMHTGQPKLLGFIDAHPGCTQKEAADELDITPASAAASLKRLEKAGWVERRPDEQDARRNRLYLTREGEEKMLAGQRAFEALDERLFSGLSEQEVENFCRTCQSMFDNLADDSCRHLTVWKLAERAREQDKEGAKT